MKSLSALRQAFGVKKPEELGKRFTPETLKRIVDAMKEYAASKCEEQRRICQFEFEQAYESAQDLMIIPEELAGLYATQSLKESETPEFD